MDICPNCCFKLASIKFNHCTNCGFPLSNFARDFNKLIKTANRIDGLLDLSEIGTRETIVLLKEADDLLVELQDKKHSYPLAKSKNHYKICDDIDYMTTTCNNLFTKYYSKYGVM